MIPKEIKYSLHCDDVKYSISFYLFIFFFFLFNRALQNKGFKFEDRGSIELKGYGPINTYFLLKNECVSDGELLGRRHRGCDGNADIIFVDEGKQEVRFDKCNKVHPWNENPSSGGLFMFLLHFVSCFELFVGRGQTIS